MKLFSMSFRRINYSSSIQNFFHFINLISIILNALEEKCFRLYKGYDKMAKGKKVAVISAGVSRNDLHRFENQEELVAEAVKDALDDCPELSIEDIDTSVFSYFSDHFEGQLAMHWILNDYIGLTPRCTMRIENGGSGPGTAIRVGYSEIASGLSDVCIVPGVEKQGEVRPATANLFIAEAADTDFEVPVGGYYIAFYGAMATRHMYLYGTTEEDFATIAVKNRNNSLDNPYSQWLRTYGKPIDVDDVLNSRMLAYPMKVLDCSLLSEGASCLVLASADVARRYTDEPVWITGVGTASDMMRPGDRIDNPNWSDKRFSYPEAKVPYPDYAKRPRAIYPEMSNFGAVREASRQAYRMAGIYEPYKEIDVVELHDAYDTSELQCYEDLGFCDVGHGKDLVREGQVELGGDIPVNPSGGLEGFGHPVGSTGIQQCATLFWQLREEIPEKFKSSKNQIDGARVALNHSHGGTGTAINVLIFER